MSSPRGNIKHLKVPKFPGCSGKCPLHSPTVGIVPSTDPTLILNLVGTNFFVAAHFHTFSSHTYAVWIFVGTSSSIVHQLLHVGNIPSLFGLAVKVASFLGVRMFVWQPVVFGILVFKVGITLLALLGPEVLEVLLAFFCITKLVLKINTRAILTTIDGRGIIALACSKSNSSATCPGTGTKFGP